MARNPKPKSMTEIIRKEIEVQTAEIERTLLLHIEDVVHGRNDKIDPKWIAETTRKEVAALLWQFEERTVGIEVKLAQGLRSGGGSFTGGMRRVFRMGGIHSSPGYGEGCDICHGGFDTPTLMNLRIGSYRASQRISLCRPCAERLAAVVDARLEDRRSKSAGNRKAS
jgi:hypothetical protein